MLNMKCIYCGNVETENIDCEYVCFECFERNFTCCSDCGEWVHNDDIRTVIGNRDSEVYVCLNCMNKRGC